jgi:hypothetical protein
VRDARRRRRRERERTAEAREREFREAQERVEPCGFCGRKPGQVAIIDVTTEARAGGSDLGAGKPGCPECIDGLPGEWARRDAIHTIRYCDALPREEIEAAKLRAYVEDS